MTTVCTCRPHRRRDAIVALPPGRRRGGDMPVCGRLLRHLTTRFGQPCGVGWIPPGCPTCPLPLRRRHASRYLSITPIKGRGDLRQRPSRGGGTGAEHDLLDRKSRSMTSTWQTHPWVTEGSSRVRFSVALGPRSDWPHLVQFVQRVEELGFDAYWVSDHPIRLPGCWTTLAGLAPLTHSVRLGGARELCALPERRRSGTHGGGC